MLFKYKLIVMARFSDLLRITKIRSTDSKLEIMINI